ncbi:translation initiation factor IF-2 [uncultured Thiothrix sp.]|uniref:translation initiation factor IF-2 n=1 Tax=uncultured Thiothrix sp. TaxID=223185 RepID=UPI002617A026|nr:translation initiation factor IF-2 [uncultured Thiothrix sp.]HMT91439.1 translation initiation factor IF-2 [Thiolinea sp.]
MSDIQVKALAAMVKAPVDVLMRQLKKAGIEVNSPEDKITDAQKLMLLERIKNEASSGRTETVDNRNTGAGKITLKRATPGGAGGNDRKPQGVEVRRKKTINLRNSEAEAQADRAAEQRAEVLARQAQSDRRTREALIEKAERERRELELQRIRRQKEAAAQVQVPVTVAPVEVVVASQAVIVEPVAVENTANLVSVAEATPVSIPSVEIEQPVVAPASQDANPEFIEENESPEAVAGRDVAPVSGMEQRQIVADAARQEASDALKRRPSRAKPKQSLAPKHVIGLEDEEPAERVASPLVDNDEGDEAKRGEKKKVKTRGRENERGNTPVIQHKGNKRKPGRAPEREVKHGFEKPTAPVIREIEIPSTILVSDLAQKLAIRATDIIKSMMKMGMMVTINQSIDQETAILVAEELGHKATPMQVMDDEAILASVLGDNSDVEVETRPPVVTIMGHVDHGKTSLLDYIRKTRVASGEAGGITQHIGAYHVDTSRGTVTFLDTPGHAAFTKMRARGAQVTDIVILIVAADDGVMPQTKEAIQHAKEANVPMVVAINKIDKPQADVDRVLNDLSQVNVLTEEWGGDVPVVRVSAKTGVGIDELLETILLVAEVQELKAPVDVPAKGTVIEASIERGRGAVATVLIREGTLRKGDILLCGTQYGRVRALFDETGRSVKEAGPSIPVAVVGLSSAPEAGDEAFVVSDERKAREIAELRQEKLRDSRFAAQNSSKLDNMFSQMQTGARAQINLLVKADVQGSVEAIRSELLKLSTDEVEVRIISSGIGGLNESDMDLAAASKAIVVAFNVRADAGARRLAQDNDVEIRYYSIIYDVINDVRAAMSGMLSPETREVFLGLAEVRNVFRASGFGQVAGCLVVEGVVRRGNPIRVLRDNVVIYEGELESLRRHRDDVKEVQVGTECGIAVKDYNDVRVGDQIEVFEHVQVARSI